MSEAKSLLPCPFCAGPGDIESRPSYSQAAATYFAYRGWCNACGFGLEWHGHEAEAIAAWNTRSDAYPALVEALEKAHDKLHECTAVLSASDAADVAEAMAQIRTALSLTHAPGDGQ